MLFRLLSPNNARALSALAVLGTFSAQAGCSSDQFTATPPNAIQAGTSGTTDLPGASGEAGEAAGGTSGGGVGGGSSGGAGAGAGTAGTAGNAPVGCDCAAGSYCQDGTKTCRSCTDFSQLSFATPEKLAALSQGSSGTERFPRAAGTGTDLFYRAGTDAASILWYAPTPVSGIGHALLSSMAGDSGPVYAPKFSPPQNFFFDRLSNANSVRQIMVGTWLDGALTNVSAAPTPINSGSGDFSVAVAADVHRAYWMSLRNNPKASQLFWATFGSSPTDPAVLDVNVQAGKGKCPRVGDDATPWVNAAGTLLLFRGESVDDNCNVNDSGAYDMFAAPLGSDGTPLAPAVALSTLNNTGGARSESDPSLSVDSCTIYYASDNGNGKFDLYRAARN